MKLARQPPKIVLGDPMDAEGLIARARAAHDLDPALGYAEPLGYRCAGRGVRPAVRRRRRDTHQQASGALATDLVAPGARDDPDRDVHHVNGDPTDNPAAAAAR